MNEATTRKDTVQAPANGEESTKNAALYDRFVEKTSDIFDGGYDKSKEAWENAMALAHQQMTKAGEFTAEQGEVFKQFLRRDLNQTRADLRNVGERARTGMHPARLGAGALSSVSKLLGLVGESLSSIADKAEDALEYHSGEISMPGTMTCLTCGHEIHLKQTSVVPECPKCLGELFRKSY